MTELRGSTAWPLVRARVAELVRTPGRLLVVSDFDGTLSEIATDPAAARILPTARAALRRLARLVATRPGRLITVLLSGRAALDVAGRVRVGGLRYLGNHGLESGELARRMRAETLVVGLDPAVGDADLDGARATSLGRRVVERLGEPAWLFLESKGPSIAFHYRQAPDPAIARAAVLRALEEVGGLSAGPVVAALELVEGRRVVEIRPAAAGGKGAAIRRLIGGERPDAVLVLGDDVSDADAFHALAEMRIDRGMPGLAVAVTGAAETPAEVVEAADLVLGSPRDAARLLSYLAGQLERESTATPERGARRA